MSKRKGWRMLKPCADCPFNPEGAGAHLRRSLHPGRMRDIKRGLRAGEFFLCHKTTDECGDGSNLVCAGALAYQETVGVTSQYVQICERLEAFAEEREDR